MRPRLSASNMPFIMHYTLFYMKYFTTITKNKLSKTNNMDTEKVRSRFIKHFDGQTGNIYMSPGRINLIGEHTDYNGGFVFRELSIRA